MLSGLDSTWDEAKVEELVLAFLDGQLQQVDFEVCSTAITNAYYLLTHEEIVTAIDSLKLGTDAAPLTEWANLIFEAEYYTYQQYVDSLNGISRNENQSVEYTMSVIDSSAALILEIYGEHILDERDWNWRRTAYSDAEGAIGGLRWGWQGGLGCGLLFSAIDFADQFWPRNN